VVLKSTVSCLFLLRCAPLASFRRASAASFRPAFPWMGVCLSLLLILDLYDMLHTVLVQKVNVSLELELVTSISRASGPC